jgi:hypothetical protein
MNRMTHDPAEHIIEILPGIDIAVFAGLDEAHVQSRRPSSPFTGDEKPVFPFMLNSA